MNVMMREFFNSQKRILSQNLKIKERNDLNLANFIKLVDFHYSQYESVFQVTEHTFKVKISKSKKRHSICNLY